MIPDYHLHSAFSSDADTDISILIARAKAMGMSSICITDHYDKDYPKTPDNLTFDLDIPDYLNTMKLTKAANSNSFDLRIGIELGIMPETATELNELVNNYTDLDFVIASSHIIDNFDPYYPEYFSGKSEKEAYRRYFESILENVKLFKKYNVYGHLDYILRYGPTKADNFSLSTYGDIIEEFLKIIINDGKGIEINTGSLYKGLSFPHPHKDILKLYKELGGEILTFGSDAHNEAHIGYAFDKTSEYIKSLGFKYYCTFKNLKPEFHNL